MKMLTITLNFTDDLGLKSCGIDYNETGLPDNSKLLEKAAFVILRSLYQNEDSVAVQDLLNELDIKVQKDL